jgi:gamma-glutamylcyclotransferase
VTPMVENFAMCGCGYSNDPDGLCDGSHVTFVPRILYFGYGANTNKESMAHRCPGAVNLGPAKLYNWAFRFAGHADIIPEENAVTEGVLWLISAQHLADLDRFEGYPNYYQRKEMNVVNQGSLKACQVYYMNETVAESLPSTGYYDLLVKGYDSHRISKEQIHNAISKIQRR